MVKHSAACAHVFFGICIRIWAAAGAAVLAVAALCQRCASGAQVTDRAKHKHYRGGGVCCLQAFSITQKT